MASLNKNDQFGIVRQRSEDEVKKLVSDLANIYQSLTHNTVCYLHGLGGQPASFYNSISKKYGGDLIWADSVLGKYWKTILRFLPSYAGIIRIHTGEEMISLFPLIAEQSMAGIYLFNVNRDNEFVKLFKQKPKESQIIVESEPTHFIYLVDEDSGSVEKGITEIIRWGIQCPSSLIEMVNSGLE